ncbi:kunitz-type U19-barytoxin-Tl1a-like [Lethenteron reissneri]|uniref:kunitz-type U19-barytoxin-Tl1a-like n=1 Tax=Lethenteron reissneri TaxID=7753 RepID=UPI002AB68794|nr:kunitz-type U19-barytoxin-Tl1a-like [Lethenteron reissneri]
MPLHPGVFHTTSGGEVVKPSTGISRSELQGMAYSSRGVLNVVVVVVLSILMDLLQSSEALNPSCNHLADEGTAVEYVERALKFYYEAQDDICLPFFYKGNGGNANRFTRFRDCMKTCSKRVSQLYPAGGKVCILSPDKGVCLAHLLRWHYNSTQRGCDVFLYGGCGGNGNRFQSREECQKMCSPLSTKTMLEKSAASSAPSGLDTGAVTGIVLGCMFAATVAATLTVFFLQRKKHSGKKKVNGEAVEMS